MRLNEKKEFDCGFTIVEVLIALVILYGGIISISAAYKMLVTAKIKQNSYQKYYMTAHSIKNYVKSELSSGNLNGGGSLNGYVFTYKADIVLFDRNTEYDKDSDGFESTGIFVITLYKVIVSIKKNLFSKQLIFHHTGFENK